jgi:putative membrane protein insertion efficiency factor
MSAAARALVFAISVYRRTLGPMLRGPCRFLPTCSVYAMEAIEELGALRGGFYAIRRVLRCHPFGGAGYDPPPHRRVRSFPD